MCDMRRFMIGSIAEEVLRSTDRPVLTVPAGIQLPPSSLKFERILFATDFGSSVQTTSSYAISLAEEFGAHVYLCHVDANADTAYWQKEKVSAGHKMTLERLVAPSVNDWCDPKCIVEFGKPSATILKLARNEKCDLIVLGAHTMGPFGSRGKPGTAFRVICETDCPVLTVASNKREEVNHRTEALELLDA